MPAGWSGILASAPPADDGAAPKGHRAADPGGGRAATMSDLECVGRWLSEFHWEALPHEEMPPASAQDARCRRLIDAGNIVLWEHEDAPVSMATMVQDLPSIAAISLVYTPPARRAQGYAGAAVGLLSDRIVASGRPSCLRSSTRATRSHIDAMRGSDTSRKRFTQRRCALLKTTGGRERAALLNGSVPSSHVRWRTKWSSACSRIRVWPATVKRATLPETGGAPWRATVRNWSQSCVRRSKR